MFPYHNQIKQRIADSQLTAYEYVENYNNIKPALVLYFKTPPFIKPIRQHRWTEYSVLIRKAKCLNE
jgi:hypothetical protein